MCDTGPLLHLGEARALHLLKLAGQVLIPPAVDDELAPYVKRPHWLGMRQLNSNARAQAAKWIDGEELDTGEAESIALALQVESDWLLTDDALARRLSESLGLETHGSIGVLLWAVAEGHIQDRNNAHELMNNLVSSSLWISDRVVEEAFRAIDELLSD